MYDTTRILAFLEQDRIYHGYTMCDLVPPLDVYSDWYAALVPETTRTERIVGLCLHFRGLMPNVLLMDGDPDAINTILTTAPQPAPLYIICRPEHEATVEKHYQLEHIDQMQRMVVDATSLQPLRPLDAEIRRLQQSEVESAKALYTFGSNMFHEYMLRDGIFYGIRQDDRLVAIAGTHCITTQYSIAAVGNVFTHPDYRGRGYAQACTHAVTHELLTRLQCREVILNVNQNNQPAITAYKRLGYRIHCPFLEAVAHS